MKLKFDHRTYQGSKLRSLAVLLIFISSGILMNLSISPILLQAQAESILIEESEQDFLAGSSENIMILGNGSDAVMTLKLEKYWADKTTSVRPSSRFGHAMASVSTDDKVVLFGGEYWNGKTHLIGDTWIYDFTDNTWSRKKTTCKPTPRMRHTMVSINGTDKVLLFGGYDHYFKNDTWIYDLSENKWTEMKPKNNPEGRYWHAMAPICGTDKALMFGGKKDNYLLNRTWIYDLSENNWTDIEPINEPNRRFGHAMSSIWGTDKVLIYSGFNTNRNTWIYDLSDNNWTEYKHQVKPTVSIGISLAPIYGSDEVLLFSGYSYTSETWVYDLSNNTWTHEIVAQSPTRRYYYSLASIPSTNRIVLYGGYSTNYLQDTWVYGRSQYRKNGLYISKPCDTGNVSVLKKINWSAENTKNTFVKVQLRSANNLAELNSRAFFGPGGSTLKFYSTPGEPIWSGHGTERWVQYKLFIFSSNEDETPILNNVSIVYNHCPVTILYSPNNEEILSTNKPVFSWKFSDEDSKIQSAFQIIIANNRKLKNPYYDSGIQCSSKQFCPIDEVMNNNAMPDATWYWRVRTMDNEGVWGQYSPVWKFIIDTRAPNSKIAQPVNNEIYNKLDTIFGVASDPINSSGLNRVELSIKHFDAYSYWNGSNWTSKPTWLLANGTAEWQYNSGSVNWTSGHSYYIQSRAIDNAENIECTGNGILFTYDTTPPISEITTPISNDYLNNLDLISGTATDQFTGIDSVEIAIRRMDINIYWTGTKWYAKKTWLPANGTECWSYNSGDVRWSTDIEYTVYSRATDFAGNYEPDDLGTKFLFDDTPPDNLFISINNGDKYTNSRDATLTQYAEDLGSGVETMSFSVDGVLWRKPEAYNISRSHWLSGLDGEKTVYFRSTDRAGNVAEPVTDTIIYDTTPPENLSISINDDSEFTNSKGVILSLYAEDSLSGVGEYTLSYDSLNWHSWDSFKNTVHFTIQSGGIDGEKIIYFRVRDNAGNVAEPVFDTIKLDATPPYSLIILINRGELETNDPMVILDLYALDSYSGVSEMSFSVENKFWTPWEGYSETRSFKLLSKNGAQVINFRVKDRAGNVAQPVIDSIVLEMPESAIDNEPDEGSLLSFDHMGNDICIIIIILIILAVLITKFVSRYRKKKRSNIQAHAHSQPKFDENQLSNLSLFLAQGSLPPTAHPKTDYSIAPLALPAVIPFVHSIPNPDLGLPPLALQEQPVLPTLAQAPSQPQPQKVTDDPNETASLVNSVPRQEPADTQVTPQTTVKQSTIISESQPISD